MDQFDLEAFRQTDGWPEETVALTDLGIAFGNELDKGLPVHEAIEEARRRIEDNNK